MNYALIEKIVKKCRLGKLLEQPIPLTGGFLHQMVKVSTTQGSYAIKLLNSEIMRRPSAKKNFATAEYYEAILEEHALPIIPAISFNGKKMQEIEGRYYYVFDYYEGKALKTHEITKMHVQKIAEALGKIHQIMIVDEISQNNVSPIDFSEMKDCDLIKNEISLLEKYQENYFLHIKNMPSLKTICHDDMDLKNVLWKGEDFRIIDLECLCLASPYIELLEMALCWSKMGDLELFESFLLTYKKYNILPNFHWEDIFACHRSRLDWLVYQVKKYMKGEEIGVASSEIKKTLEELKWLDAHQAEILEMLRKSDTISFRK